MRYDPGAKFQVDEIGRNKEAVNDELSKLKDNIRQLKEEVSKKKGVIKELKTKKRSVKNLINRNKLMYCYTRYNKNREQQYGKGYFNGETIKFPFIVLSTQNHPENAVCFG